MPTGPGPGRNEYRLAGGGTRPVGMGCSDVAGAPAGIGHKMFSLAVIGVHVRLLVAIPLFFLCETWVAPRMAEFVRNIVRSGLVPEDELPALASDIRRVGRMKDSWLAEVLFLLVAFALPLIETVANLPGRTGNWALILAQAGGRLTLVNGWYLGFCLPLFRFLMFRWLWHLGLWWYFLWRVRKTQSPPYPDSLRRRGRAGVPGGCAGTFHSVGTGDLGGSFRIFCGRHLLGDDGVRDPVPLDSDCPASERGAVYRPALYIFPLSSGSAG